MTTTTNNQGETNMSNRMEKFWQLIAWRLPRPLAYWCALRVTAHATQGQYGTQNVPELTAMDALKRWESTA